MPSKDFREKLIQSGTDSHLQIDIDDQVEPEKQSRNWGGFREGAGGATRAQSCKAL